MSKAQPQPDPTRFVICDIYAEGCGKGFSVPLKQWNPSAEQICPDCTRKQTTRTMLKSQLRMAQQMNLTDEIQELENLLDQLDGYTWRDTLDSIYDRIMARHERTAGGAVY